jgi:hypothetical protein
MTHVHSLAFKKLTPWQMVVIVRRPRMWYVISCTGDCQFFDWWRYSFVGRDMYMFWRVTDAQCLVGDVNLQMVEVSWNVMAHAQKPDLVFRWNGRVHLSRRGRQFSRLLAAEVCASAVVMLDTPCSEVVWRVLPTHSIRQFPLHLPFRASPCAITFQLEFTKIYILSPL